VRVPGFHPRRIWAKFSHQYPDGRNSVRRVALRIPWRQNLPEHFQEKRTPIFPSEMRQRQKLEHIQFLMKLNML
jgi:hypothetical protein